MNPVPVIVLYVRPDSLGWVEVSNLSRGLRGQHLWDIILTMLGMAATMIKRSFITNGSIYVYILYSIYI